MNLINKSWLARVAAPKQQFWRQLHPPFNMLLILILAGCAAATTGGYIIWTSPKTGNPCSYPALTADEQKTEFLVKYKTIVEVKLLHEQKVKKLHDLDPGDRLLEYARGQACIDLESERITKEDYRSTVSIWNDLQRRLVLARTKQLSDFDRLVAGGERALETEAWTVAEDAFRKAMALNDQDLRVHWGLAEASYRLPFVPM